MQNLLSKWEEQTTYYKTFKGILEKEKEEHEKGINPMTEKEKAVLYKNLAQVHGEISTLERCIKDLKSIIY